MKCMREKDDPLFGMPLGMAYVPIQEWGCLYDPAQAFAQGTLFPNLDLPWCGCIPKGARMRRGGRP